MTLRKNIFPLSLLIALSVSCGSKSEFKRGTTIGNAKLEKPQDNAAANAEIPGAHRDPAAPSSTAGNGISSSIADEDPSPEAQAPSIIAGASLHCMQAAELLKLACFVEDETGKNQLIPKSKQMAWRFSTGLGVTLPLLTIVPVDTKSAGTIFFVTMPAKDVVLHFDGLDQTIHFDTAPLFKPDAPLKRFAMPALQLPRLLGTSGPVGSLGVRFGDGRMNQEEDSCLGSTEPTAAPGTRFTADLTLSNPQPGSSVYLSNVCGVQSANIAVELTGPAPFRPITLYLMPESTTVKLFEGLDMAAGAYSFRLRHTVLDMPGGSLDDFSFDRFHYFVQGNVMETVNLRINF